MKKTNVLRFLKKVVAGCLTAAVCVTSLPTGGLQTAEAATPAERKDPSIIYFVDCGDYVVDTVSSGDQLGTHNSVTDQAYGEDPGTGYKWGIVDEISDPLKNGTGTCGGVFTDNTWPFEQNTANKDTSKTSSNRYTKNQFESGIQERYLDYKFELENGNYQVTICCVDPWGVSKSPNAYLNYGKSNQITLKEGVEASAQKPAKGSVEVTDGELTVNLRGTGDDNKAINLAYILVTEYKEETADDIKTKVSKDCAALTLSSTELESDIVLPTQGENETNIVWSSSDETAVSSDGKVTRPEAGKEDIPVTLTATISYGEFSMTKEFQVKVLARSDMGDLQEFSYGNVTVTDEYYNTVTKKDVEFLNKFDPDRLMYNFRLTAGYSATEIKEKDIHGNGTGASSPYPGGWENSRIGGHTLGHYLAAAAQAVANGYGEEVGDDGFTLKQRLEYLIEELKDCQDKRGTGYIFGATMANANDPERQFNLLENGTTADTWVPWYTMHKIVNGLVETYKLTGNETSLLVAENLGEWIYERTSKWTTTIQNRVLNVEYGGMNDCLYELYKCARDTGYADKDHFKEAAHWFDETSLFERVLAGEENVLNGKHANCTIPKFMGALNRYRALEDETYLEYAEAFWTLIIEKHTYITGGNSECEFFGADNILDLERSHCNNETCNTHDMLKLTRELYRITGDKKYADYYENTFVNAIMASVNAETGMTTYFQPMATGYYKVYCNPDLEKNYFWCCTGTGLENFTKLGDSFYYYTGDKLIVNQYTSSNVTWKDKGITLKQETSIPETDTATFTVQSNGSTAFDLRLRVPDWTKGAPVVKLNGTVQNVTVSNGYISLNRTWKNNDKVELTLPMGIASYTLPDNAGVTYGFKYGPIVLAAELGLDEDRGVYQIGVQCDVCSNKIVNGQKRSTSAGYGSTSNQGTLSSETLNVLAEDNVATYIGNIEKYLVKDSNPLTFTLKGTDWSGKEDLKFTPYYKITDQRYGIYWLFAQSDGNSETPDQNPTEKPGSGNTEEPGKEPSEKPGTPGQKPTEKPGSSSTVKPTVSPDGKTIQTITAEDIVKTMGDQPFNLDAETDGDGTLTYESKNPGIVKVDGTGRVTIVSAGTAKISVTASATDTYSSAKKTVTVTVIPEEYMPIYDIGDLYKIREAPWGKYILVNDIDMSATQKGGNYDLGNGWSPIEIFNGTLDGNGHRIIGMHIFGEFDSQVTTGLFKECTGSVKNLGIVNCDIDITAKDFATVGAIAGYGQAWFENCYASGKITVRESNRACYVGGLFGTNSSGSNLNFVDCYNACDIDCSQTKDENNIGGICGYSSWVMYQTRCVNTGIIRGNEQTKIGAMCGEYKRYFFRENLYYLKGTALQGVADTADDSNCVSLTEAQMKNSKLFTGFDFTDTWEVDPYCSYPYPQLKNNRMIRIDGIRLDTAPAKLTYNQGESLKLNGAALEISYEDGINTTIPLEKNMLSGYDMNKIGKQAVTVSYGGEETSFDIEVREVQVSGISIPKTLSLDRSKQKQLTVSITPANASDKTVTWKSDNPGVASVNSSGLVKAKARGTAVITATAANGIQASCTVTVLVPAVSVKLSQSSLSMAAGSQRSIKAQVLPLESTDSVNWKSSNQAVAEVYDGNILAKKEGTAKITAYTKSGAKASCTVTVKKPGDGASSEIKKITSKKAKIKSAKNVKKKSVKLKLGGSVNGSGYKIQYGTSRKFKGAKTVTAKGSSATIKKLKIKKTYYIRVRIYKKISGRTYYGKWSSVKSVKIKK